MIALHHTALLVMVALLVGFITGIVAGRQFLIRASLGEAIVANTIVAHFSRPHVLLNNVTLPTKDGTTQVDHILIADTGIFVIETKHYQGWIYGAPNEAQWTQVIYKKKSRFQNPIRQNFGHLKSIQSLFNLPDNHFIPLVVFTGNAEFKTDLGPSVLKISELIPFLTQSRPVVFDERKMAYVIGRFEMKRSRRSLETDEYHINYVRSRVARS
ncbi:MAG TPA: nuclease-related domain-containing protein [Verrucomicrobiota bacterium]|nr:nuclease-related domain-containing protein [Verrucomicrobiota bacterium]